MNRNKPRKYCLISKELNTNSNGSHLENTKYVLTWKQGLFQHAHIDMGGGIKNILVVQMWNAFVNIMYIIM